ncbi:Protein McrC [Methanosarcinales archaeon]|nr:Protein McrC [Methanosarcinales archaeon]
MTEKDETIIIPEYKSEIINNFNEILDWDYLERSCFKYKGKFPYKISINRDKNICIENTSYSGIIQLENVRIHFSTKVKTNLFYMLSFLKSEDEFLFDPEISIDIKEGTNFFDIIGRLFLNELEKIIEKGLLKNYIQKHENINFLKGKLSIKCQIHNHINNRPKFSCIYGDLTINNLENQIILRSLNLLIPMIRFNEELKADLIRHEYILKDFIELIDVSPNDCNQIHFNRLNDYYSAIIQFSKLILEENFIRSVYKGESRGFNFIVNMNKVYEDFITQMVTEVVEENFDHFEVVSQTKFDSLVKERRIVTIPDIILKSADSYPLIIDAKYKREDKNSDYYQVIAYSLAIPQAKACCLIYPHTEIETVEKELTLRRDITNPEGTDIKLYARTIDLHIKDGFEFDDFVKDTKIQIRNIILDCLPEEQITVK